MTRKSDPMKRPFHYLTHSRAPAWAKIEENRDRLSAMFDRLSSDSQSVQFDETDRHLAALAISLALIVSIERKAERN